MSYQNTQQLDSLQKFSEYLLKKEFPADTVAFICGRFLQTALVKIMVEFSADLKGYTEEQLKKPEFLTELLTKVNSAVQAKHGKTASDYIEQLLSEMFGEFYSLE